MVYVYPEIGTPRFWHVALEGLIRPCMLDQALHGATRSSRRARHARHDTQVVRVVTQQVEFGLYAESNL